MNRDPDGPGVLWMNLSGHYRHYTDYRSSIKFLPGGKASPPHQ